MTSVLLTLGLLLLAQAEAEPEGGGLIRGVLTDATGAVLPGGFIRVFQTPSNALITRLRVEPDGVFQTGQLQPGSYIVVAWVQGFSARRSSVVILEGQMTDMGKIQLEVGSCDAPGIMCDDFGIGPPDRIRSQGYLELKMDCGVNLRESKVYCPDAPGGPKGQAFDVRATREGVAVYLTAVNGSSFSHQRAGESRIRVDGMGPGDDIWVRTRQGLQAHIFFVDDVEPISQSIRIWHVTR
jgi:Carboxypeptidase regulatory-like domain